MPGDDAVSEKVTKASGAYPARVERPTPGFEVALTSVPLVVDDRLRVLNAENRVWAEPLEAPQKTSAYWSYERDETLNTVVQAKRTGRAPLVISLWSDGALIAVDASTGAVAWRAQGPEAFGGWSAFNHDFERTAGCCSFLETAAQWRWSAQPFHKFGSGRALAGGVDGDVRPLRVGRGRPRTAASRRPARAIAAAGAV